MASKPTIAIDIDDVVADGTSAFINAVNERYDLALTSDDYHSIGGNFKGYYERVWAAHGVEDVVNFDELSEEMIVDQSHVPLLAGAEFAITELSKRFHIVFITARPKDWETATRRWFLQHFNQDNVELYFAGSHDGTMKLTKGQQAVELGARLLIDDNPRNCLSALDEGLQAVLFGDYGWHSDAPHSMKRCKDWPELLEYLDGTEL